MRVAQGPPVVLRAGWLFDGTGAPPVRNAALWLREGVVAYAGPAGSLPEAAAGAAVLEFPGATLLPGLVDAHVHLVASGGAELAAEVRATPATLALKAAANARRQLDAGVTLVRDLGAPGDEAIAVGLAVEAGELEGPRVVAAGPAVTMTAGHIPYLGRVADGVEGMRAAVRANLALGARCIKVVASGGVLTKGLDPRKASYSLAELTALVDEAHRFDLRVAAHAIGEGGVLAALRAGVDSIEHGMFLDAESVQLLVDTGARYVPTFSAPDGILRGPSVPEWTKARARPAAERQARSFSMAVEAGVRIVAGTDAGTPENFHGGVAGEVAQLVTAGLAPALALRAATAEAADLLGEPCRGALRQGMCADVLVAGGDAVADVAALTRPLAIFQDGARAR